MDPEQLKETCQKLSNSLEDLQKALSNTMNKLDTLMQQLESE
jgi:ABC-type transporter Mla subunit MlaD